MNMMFKHFLFIVTFAIIAFESALCQNINITQPKSDNIKSLQMASSGNSYLLPIIDINSNEELVVKFDNLDISQPRLRYKIYHCNSDWTLSDISEVDYLDGFNDNIIKDYSFSNNTLVNYIHYDLRLPNSDIGLKLSGNYVLAVYDEYSPNDILLTACFSVIDSKVQVSAKVTGNTDIDFNREHQQLSLDINYKNLNVQNPNDDFKVVVRQNTRFDNRVENIKPTYLYSDRLVFEHNRELIFEAGNEYRRFETVSRKYGGIGVGRVSFESPYLNAYVNIDDIRANNTRHYDIDQNGSYLIRNSEAVDSDVESDYFLVHFALDASKISKGNVGHNIYLDGEFTYGNSIGLDYDIDNGIYYTSMLLKQGAYNYQYLVGNDTKSTAIIEGNYYNTENSYSIFVYYRPPGRRYDMLVGFLQIESGK